MLTQSDIDNVQRLRRVLAGTASHPGYASEDEIASLDKYIDLGTLFLRFGRLPTSAEWDFRDCRDKRHMKSGLAACLGIVVDELRGCDDSNAMVHQVNAGIADATSEAL